LAIAFARIQFVKRSAGQNACHKAAYNGRMAVTNERTGESYNYIQKGDGAYHAVLLPEGVNARFKDPKVLWNAAEKRETRINSQVALEGVIALPDDACMTMEDRIEIAHRAAHHFFVRHGLAVQVDIHEPHDDEDHNWHAHFLATTRTFTPGGNALGEKAREYMARYREGNLHSGEEYRKIQNDYFAEKGYDLRVDENGIIAQAHLGPVRLRARAEAMMQSHLERLSANQNASRDPAKILEHLTERNSVFTREDVERYLSKHVPVSVIDTVRTAFWKQQAILQLSKEEIQHDTLRSTLDDQSALAPDEINTHYGDADTKTLPRFTTQYVRLQENRILRIADRLQAKAGVFRLTSNDSKGVEIAQKYSLSWEQLAAFEGAVLGQRLVCIQGRAGTGKSHVMAAIRERIESKGCRVRGLAPTSSVAKDLESKGFDGAQNLHRFLFQQQNGIDPLRRKDVLMIDEAGMVGNTVMEELLKVAWDKGAHVILVGDDRQLPSVDRGGMFKVFCERYGAYELTEVRRQTKDWQKAMSETLSQGVSGVRSAVSALEKNRCLHWVNTKDDALVKLVELWKQDRLQERVANTMDTKGGAFSDVSSYFIMEHRNRYALVLNEMVRNVRKEWGELTGVEYRCDTFIGQCYVSQGDRIQFRANDRELGITNGLMGTLIETKETCFVVKTDEGREVAFNPKTCNRYQLGYAGTYHQSQGKTVDHAYALHSPYMTHNLFYVGLTRQKDRVHYIVSKDEARNRETLIAQLSRDGTKETTVRYLTPLELMKGKDKNSLFTTAFNYVRDKLYRNDGFYRVNDKITVNDETFRGYSVKALTAQDARAAGQGEPTIKQSGKTSDLIRPAQRTITGNTRIRPPQSHQKEKALDGRQELDRMVSTLKERIPEVCQALFPETQPQVRGHEWRYGTKGSLKVNISGPKRGGYANFETGDKGGPLHLICEARNCTMKEAIAWAKSFLQRDVASNRLPGMIPGPDRKDQHEAKTAPVSWTSLVPTSDRPAPQLGDGCLAKLAHHNRETARYTYTDEQSTPLFHVVRLEPKDAAKTGKMTLPLSYGLDTASSPSTPCWALKKYQSSDNHLLPLYNLKELMDHPSKPVLVVEGEKTAEAAQQIFPEMVVTTWHGGAGNVADADLSPLKGREVVLWPDNDAIGHTAMETMALRCKEVGAKSIQMVGLAFGKDAQKLPEKWDLADPLPKGLTKDMVRQKLAELGISLLPAQMVNDYIQTINLMKQNGYEPYMIENFKAFFKHNPTSAINAYKSVHLNTKNIDQCAINPKIKTCSPERQALQYIKELKIAHNTLEYYTALKQKDKIEAQQSLIHSLQKTIIQKSLVMEHLSRLDTNVYSELKRFEQEQLRQQHLNHSKGVER
jgi:Ti-type conjugative transfer relaxase TraA